MATPTTETFVKSTTFNYSRIYPNPFFDVLNHYIPTDLKLLFDWFEYLYFSNPIISTVINRLAEYPITELNLVHSDPDVMEAYRREFEKLNWKSFVIRAGIEYYVYGSAFVVGYEGTQKLGYCQSCGSAVSVERIRKFKLGSKPDYATGVCPNCGNLTSFTLRDASTGELHLTLWNPRWIKIKRNPLTEQYRYYSDIPPEIKEGILKNDTFIISTTPQPIIEAVKEGKLIEFPPQANTLFHMRRPYLSGKSSPWGTSLILPVMKHLFLIQVYRKANEVIALEHILPMRIIFPQQSSTNTEPALTIPMGKLKAFLEEVISRFRQDPGQIITSPIPLGELHIGGQGKMLDVTDLIQALTQEVIAGLGVPQEFVYGGLTWTGTSVSLRMLENQLQNYIGQINRLLAWIADRISLIKDLPKLDDVKLKPFKMVDDISRKQLALELAGNGLISRTTLLGELGYDFHKELERMQEEQELFTLAGVVPPPVGGDDSDSDDSDSDESDSDEPDEGLPNNRPPRNERNMVEKEES
jgi:hypothetical protein